MEVTQKTPKTPMHEGLSEFFRIFNDNVRKVNVDGKDVFSLADACCLFDLRTKVDGKWLSRDTSYIKKTLERLQVHFCPHFRLGRQLVY